MAEFLKEWWDVLSQLGLGGFAVYALVHVWNRLIAMSDAHRLDTSARETAHREELKTRDDMHRQELKEMQNRHQQEMSELIQRNMDEHRERNRVQVMLGMTVAEAWALNGRSAPKPYPDVDESGREDPRKG